MAIPFDVGVNVAVKLSVDFGDRLAHLILDSGTEDKQLRAFAHTILNAFDGEDTSPPRRREIDRDVSQDRDTSRED